MVNVLNLFNLIDILLTFTFWYMLFELISMLVSYILAEFEITKSSNKLLTKTT